MNINKIQTQQAHFSGWIPRGENNVWMYCSQNNYSTRGIKQLVDSIEANSRKYFIDF